MVRKNKGTVKETYKRIWEIVYGKRRIREDFMDEEKKLFQDLGDHPSLRQLETLIEQVKNQPTEEQRIVRIFLKKADIFISSEEAETALLKIVEKTPLQGVRYLQEVADKVEENPSIIPEKVMQTLVWFIFEGGWKNQNYVSTFYDSFKVWMSISKNSQYVGSVYYANMDVFASVI